MTEQNKKNVDIIEQEIAGTLAEALDPIAPPANRAGALKSRVMARVRGKKAFDLMTSKLSDLIVSARTPSATTNAQPSSAKRVKLAN